jgi:hypothetical protein
MQHTRAFVVLVSGALLAATLGCAPEDGTCDVDVDCPFGQVCMEGVCANANGGAFGGGGAVGGGAFGGAAFDGGGGSSSQGLLANVPASLEGSIGGTEVRSTMGTVTLDFGRVTLHIPDDRFASTFLFVAALPPSVFSVQGRQTIRVGGLDEGYSQACNYDTGGYDEFFNEFIIDVGAPRDPVPGDEEKEEEEEEELVPGSVIDVSITVAGEGSNVVGTAVVPSAMLGL